MSRRDTIPLGHPGGVGSGIRCDGPDELRRHRGRAVGRIFEVANAGGELLGVERVSEIIRAKRNESPGRIVEALRDGITKFAPGIRAADDRTAIVVKAL